MHHGILAKLLIGVTASARDAVMVFFVMSGFLVGGKAMELLRAPDLDRHWQRFLVDRVSRIFVVLWPVLLLSAACLFAVLAIAPNAPFVRSSNWSEALYFPLASDLSVLRWIGAALLLNNFGISTIQIDGPLWSLSYEWYYYLAALAIVLLVRRHFTPATVLLIGLVAVLAILSHKFSPSLLPMGSAWLFGAAAREIFDRGWLNDRRVFWLSTAAAIGSIIARDLGYCGLIAVGCFVAILISNRFWQSFSFAAKQGAVLSGFSYSLYLVHFPLLTVVAAVVVKSGDRLPATPLSLLLWAAVSSMLVVCAWAFSSVTEAKTHVVRRWMLRWVEKPAARVAVAEVGD